MIQIPVVKNVGGRTLPLAKCYDNSRAMKSIVGKLRKAHTLHAVREIEVAQKTLYLIYCDPEKV